MTAETLANVPVSVEIQLMTMKFVKFLDKSQGWIGRMTVTAMLVTLSSVGRTETYETDDEETSIDSLVQTKKASQLIHQISADFCPGGILHTNDFLVGLNPEERTMNHATTIKLKYAFMDSPDSPSAHIYKGAYQGLGIAYHEFNPQLHNPVSAFLFQGARIVGGRRISLNYEWNLGLAFGWNPYDRETNPDNRVIGSKVTAYIDADLYASIALSRWLDLNVGISVSHFSNGNTSYPNMGLNTLTGRTGLTYYVNRPSLRSPSRPYVSIPFHRHLSYDLVLFGSWRKRGYTDADTYESYTLPGTYAVWGFNFNPMYNVSHWMNVGLSLDGVYDRSANYPIESFSYFDDPSTWSDLHRPSTVDQMALGLSARMEFVMPYFTINMGFGRNILNDKGDFSGFYQILALKMSLTHHTFLHIGYSLIDMKNPRFLMLGIGYRFNSQRKWR